MNEAASQRGALFSPVIVRRSLGVAALAGLAVSAQALLPAPPFSLLFTACAALSGAVHAAFWLTLGDRPSASALKALAWFNVALLTVAVSDTGGAFSPFVFVYLWIIFAGAASGVAGRALNLASAAGYLAGACLDIPGLLGLSPSVQQPGCSGPTAVFAAALAAALLLASTYGVRHFLFGLGARLEADEEERRRLLSRFAQLDSSSQIGLLAHRIAHDLRGPLASVSGYLEMELSRPQSEDDRRTLRGVMDSVDNMARALAGITRFGKPGAAGEEVIHLPEFISDLVGIASYSPKAKGVKFEVSAADPSALRVRASRSELQQAVFNLLKNALEAVGAAAGSGKVELRLCRVDGRVLLQVSDNGPGMSAEALSEVFVRSFTTKPEGTGVGLMITRDLLLRNGGEIRLRNAEGGGLTAEISLPAGN